MEEEKLNGGLDVVNAAELAGEKGKFRSERGKTRKYVNFDGEEVDSLTSMQELYCNLRAEGHNPTRAYRIAFPNMSSGHSQSAAKLEGMEKIRGRIELMKEERAWAAKLVDPQESLVRWNELYWDAKREGNTKVMIECQKQIDKINGAEAAVIRQQLEVKGLFRGEGEEEWRTNAEKLLRILAPNIEIINKK